MNHEKLAILFPFFNFFAFQTPSPNKCLLNTRAWAENNGYQAWKGPCGQLCWFMRATAGRLFSRLISRVRRPILWNMKKKVSMHVNIIARNLVQHQSLPNTFTYQISLMNHEKLAILFPFFNFFAFQMPSPNECHFNTRAWSENNGY